MKTNNLSTNNLLKDIKRAATELKDCKMKKEPTEILRAIAETAHLSDTDEAIVLTIFFDRQCAKMASNIGHISNYINCSVIDVLHLQTSIKSLLNKGVIAIKEDGISVLENQYLIARSVFDAIASNTTIAQYSSEEETPTNMSFIEKTQKFILARKRGVVSTQEMLNSIASLEKGINSKLAFIQSVNSIIDDIADRVLFYEMCNDATLNLQEGQSEINTTIQDLFDSLHLRIRQTTQLLSKVHPLITNGLIELDPSKNDAMQVTDKGLELLLEEDPTPYRKNNKATDRYDFIEKIDKGVFGWKIIERESRNKVQQIEAQNSGASYVCNLQKIVSDLDLRILFYLTVNAYLDNDTFPINRVRRFMPKSAQLEVVRSLKAGTSRLQTEQLVRLTNETHIDNSSLTLTEKGKQLFFEEDYELFTAETEAPNLIKHNTISQKELFFEPNLQRQLHSVATTLEETKYKKMVERLHAKQLPTGIAVLLYGQPGTGKTETVMQIAKQTGRNIMHVDISQAKSCWFGESEKMIKGIFENYRKVCEKSTIKPILLFNEADAIFSKRKDSTFSNVAQTENAIQNIILEEMEKLDGILIATTNLADNLDRAFDRRFLFKIRFERPTIEAKINIWQNKMTTLNDEEASRLASLFDFSGGEIDNIVRKANIEEITTGVAPSFNMLLTLCNEEKMAHKHSQQIGFC